MYVYGITPPLADPVKDPVVDPVAADALRYQAQCAAALNPQVESVEASDASGAVPEFGPEFLPVCEE